MKRHRVALFGVAIILAGTLNSGLSAAQAGQRGELAGGWVAMGDSYQAGVGANRYDDDSGSCQRSPLSHTRLIDADGLLVDEGGAKIPLTHVACSGAETDDLYTGRHGEPPQIDQITTDTRFVTLGITGNDMGFGDVLKYCIGVTIWVTCATEQDPGLREKLAQLEEPTQPLGFNRLEGIIRDIQSRAPDAKVFVLTYPRFFTVNGHWDRLSTFLVPGGAKRCSFIRISDQIWMNAWIKRLNAYIVNASLATGAIPVDLYDVPDGHELCSDAPKRQQHLNGVTLRNRLENSFHPKRWGYESTSLYLWSVMCDHLASPAPDVPSSPTRLDRAVTVAPGRTRVVPVTLAGGPAAAFRTVWQEGDFTVRLRGPDGRLVKLPPTGARQVRTPDSDTLASRSVRAPAAGRWTLEIANTGATAQQVRVGVSEAAEPNAAPRARIQESRTGARITLDAGGSTDEDGRIKKYLWEFADGTLAEGRWLSRPSGAAGLSGLRLVVVDDRGGVDVAEFRVPA